MNDAVINAIEQEYLKTGLPNIKIGQTVIVYVKVVEGNKERIQAFEGTVIGRKGEGTKETITIRRVSYGVGVERIFPLHSPIISKIEIKTIGKVRVRRAKLYYLRDRVGKAAKIRVKMVAKNQ